MVSFGIEQGKKLLGGLVTDTPSHAISRQQSPDAQNFDPSAGEGIVKRNGFVKYSGTGDGSGRCTGLFASTMTSGAYPTFVLTSRDTILFSVPPTGAWTTLTGTSITDNTPVEMVMFDDRYIIANEGGGPWQWDGAAAGVSDLGSDATQQAQVADCNLLEVHKNRLFVSGRTVAPSRIYWSDLHDPTKFLPVVASADAGNEDVYKNDGMIINGIRSNGDVLFVSKLAKDGSEGALYGYFGNDPNQDTTIRRVAHFGALSQRAMMSFDGVMIVADARGIHSISAKGVALLSRDIQNEYEDIPDKSSIVLGRYLNQIWVAYDSNNGGANNAVFVLDLGKGRWSKYNQGETASIVGNIGRMYNHPTTGKLLTAPSNDSSNLFIYQHATGITDLNSDGNPVGIDFYWSTPDLDWDTFFQDKIAKTVYLYTEDTGDFDITITRSLDGAPVTDSVPVVANVQGAGAATKVVNRAVVPSGDRNSRFVRFKFRNAEASEPIIIYGWSSLAEILEPTRGAR